MCLCLPMYQKLQYFFFSIYDLCVIYIFAFACSFITEMYSPTSNFNLDQIHSLSLVVSRWSEIIKTRRESSWEHSFAIHKLVKQLSMINIYILCLLKQILITYLYVQLSDMKSCFSFHYVPPEITSLKIFTINFNDSM